MNLYHLKYFYDSARLGSITQSAKVNRVGQPAISKGILNLEAFFKKNLIVHERNRFQLTEDGETVYSYCQKIFSITDELTDALNVRQVPIGLVRFACPSSLADTEFLSQFIYGMSVKYPKVKLKLVLGRTDLITDWVHNDISDFAIALDNVSFSGLKATPIRKGFFHLVCTPDIKDHWQDMGIFATEPKGEVVLLKQKYEEQYHHKPNIKMEIGSWTVIKRFVTSGLGAGLIPDYLMHSELNKKKLVRIEPKKFSIPYEINIVHKIDKYIPKRCELAIQELMKSARSEGLVV